MRFIFLILFVSISNKSLANQQGVYIPPRTDDPRLREQIVRLTLGDNEKTAVVKYQFGSITRLVFPTDTNTASCDVDSTIVFVENPRASESLKGANMYFRRITLKTYPEAGEGFTALDDKHIKSNYIKMICSYERFNQTYERVIMVQVMPDNGYGVVFFEHPDDRYYAEYRRLMIDSVRQMRVQNGEVVEDQRKEVGKADIKLPDSGPRLLIIPQDRNRSPYWQDGGKI